MEYKWNPWYAAKVESYSQVLILVLMEYKWNTIPLNNEKDTYRLNPCFNGIQMEHRLEAD